MGDLEELEKAEEIEMDLLDPESKQPLQQVVDILPAVPEGSEWKHIKLTQKSKMGIRLVASGLKHAVAAKIVGISVNTLQLALWCNEGKEYMKSLQEGLDLEFRLLQKKVIRTIDRGLDSASIDTQLKAADFYAKYSGVFTQKIKLDVSAEDLVQQIMKGANNATPALPEGNRTIIQGSEQGGGDS